MFYSTQRPLSSCVQFSSFPTVSLPCFCADVQERILNPHAASCTCAACCDDLTEVSRLCCPCFWRINWIIQTVCDSICVVSDHTVMVKPATTDGHF